MKHSEFVNQVDDAAIAAAIEKAETKSTGQIRAFVSRRKWPDPTAAARKHFQALGMAKTRQRNAILIFMAPASRTFAIYGDAAIHEFCGPEFWNALRDEMAVFLKQSRYTAAIVHAVERAGTLLATHFPAAAGDKKDEGQSNEVARD